MTHARARNSDGANSHLAAESVKGITEVKRRILYVFDRYGAMTHEQLIENYGIEWGISFPASDSGLRSRCCDLWRKGYLVKTKIEGTTENGRPSTVWQLAGVLF